MASATGTYVGLTALKLRLKITDTNDDSLLQSICDQVNSYIEGFTSRVLTSIASTTYTFDGQDAVNSRCLQVDSIGVREISLLEVAPYTGASFVTIPSTDYFIRPTVQEREPGWPATEVWITDIPSATNTYPYFPRGYANIRITGSWGWPTPPDDIVDLALTTATRVWNGRQAGQQDVIGTDAFGRPVVSRYLSGRDRETLTRYRVKTVDII